MTVAGSISFAAVGKDIYGNVVAVAPTWSVAAGGGTITAAGLFTAGTTAGTYPNTVRAASGGISGSATVTVTATAGEPRIGLSPVSLSFSGKAGSANPAAQTVTVSNTGGGTMSWSATKVMGTAWLVLTPASGAAPSAVTVSVGLAGLAPGTYGDTIQVAGAGAGNSPRKLPVSLTVAASTLATITLSPASVTLASGGTQAFSAVGRDAAGNVLAITPTWSVVAGGGAISPTGTFTAGGTAGTYAGTVKAASGAIAGSATVTVTVSAPQIGLSPVTLSFTGKAGSANPAAQTLTVSNTGGGTLSWTATKLLGAAWLLLTPASGTAPSSVAVSASLAGLAAGTYSDTIQVAGTGAGNSPRKLPVSLTVTAADTGAAPDVIANESFENGWGVFTNGGSSAPLGATIATDYAYDGTHSARYAWTGGNSGDIGANMYSVSSGSYDRWWVRVYFRLTAHITSTWKFIRFYDRSISTNLGGLWLGSDANGGGIIGVGWDREDEAIVTPIGLTEAQVIDGKWHELEVDFQRNGGASGYPEASFWFDGKPQYAEYNGHSTVKYWGSGNTSSWVNGRINAGARASSVQMGAIEWMGTLNAGNQSSGQANMDRIAISSRGLIGP